MYLTQQLDKGKKCKRIYFDFNKAFDKVLQKKLKIEDA